MRICWQVLSSDRRLLWLPLLGWLLSAALLVAPVLPLLVGTGPGGNNLLGNPLWWLLLLVCLFAAEFVTVFFHAALVCGVLRRFAGDKPTLGGSIGGAWRRPGALLSWSLLLVGILSLGWGTERSRISRPFVRIVRTAGEVGWDIASFLVIPVICSERSGSLASLRRSMELLRNTWGENLAAQVWLRVVGLLSLVLVTLLAVAASVAAGFVVTALIVVWSVWGVWSVLTGIVVSAVRAVYQSALYVYAKSGSLPDTCEQMPAEDAFMAV